MPKGVSDRDKDAALHILKPRSTRIIPRVMINDNSGKNNITATNKTDDNHHNHNKKKNDSNNSKKN